MTLSGPTGTPALRSARAKWTTFSANLKLGTPQRKGAKNAKESNSQIVDHAFNGISEDDSVEVDQQPEFLSSQSKIGQQLCFVNGKNSLERFDFNDNASIDQHVQSKFVLQALVLVKNFNFGLPDDIQSSGFQLDDKSLFVYEFQHSWAQDFVNFDSGPDDFMRQRVLVHMASFAPLY
jgi:hypothetical protein